jgi:hypothetical protein
VLRWGNKERLNVAEQIAANEWFDTDPSAVEPAPCYTRAQLPMGWRMWLYRERAKPDHGIPAIEIDV